jgi:lysyl-tRNA synthetase class 2
MVRKVLLTFGAAEIVDVIEPGEETDHRYRIAGRLTARRGHGKASFLDLRDGTGQIQVQARVNELGDDAYQGLLSLDIGDIVGIEGTVFASKRGELSIRAYAWELLSKSLRPPPEKFHGLEDVETRYRRRELDLMSNDETRELFLKRARTIAQVRRWFDARGFVEVETPVLQPLYGGALARPFDSSQRPRPRPLPPVATELYLKRLVVGGIERVYSSARTSATGISHKHNPEFTCSSGTRPTRTTTTRRPSWRGWSRRSRSSARTTKVEREGGRSTSPPWRRSRSVRRSREDGIDVLEHPRASSSRRRWGANPTRRRAGETRRWPALEGGRADADPADLRRRLSGRALAVRQAPPQRRRTGGALGGLRRWHRDLNSFTELNDPDEQRRRFEQAEEIARGDRRPSPTTRPSSSPWSRDAAHRGAGLGIDRLVMILTGAKSLRGGGALPGDAELAAGRLRSECHRDSSESRGTGRSPPLRPGTHLAPQSFARGIGGLHGGERESHPRSSTWLRCRPPLEHVVMGNEILRTTYVEREGRHFVVGRPRPIGVPVVELDGDPTRMQGLPRSCGVTRASRSISSAARCSGCASFGSVPTSTGCCACVITSSLTHSRGDSSARMSPVGMRPFAEGTLCR